MGETMLEKDMLKSVKQKTLGQRIQITNIETGGVSVGVPDWFIRTEYNDIWMEAKEIKRWPVRDNTTIKISFRPGQYNWLKRHQELGGNSLLIVTYKYWWYLFKDIKRAYTKEEMNTLSLIPQDFKNMTIHRFTSILYQGCLG